VILLGHRANTHLVPKFHSGAFACLSCNAPSINIKSSLYSSLPVLTSTFHHMLPSYGLGLLPELGVLIYCSGTLLNFTPCSIFHLYLLHFLTSYFLSNLPLPEGRTRTAWGPSGPCFPITRIVSHYPPPHFFSLCPRFQRVNNAVSSESIKYCRMRSEHNRVRVIRKKVSMDYLNCTVLAFT
jgi:hypothetical protein